MAKVRDLLRRVEAKLQDSFDTIDVLDWFNECQNDLAEFLFLPTIAVITRNGEGKFILPDDYNGYLRTKYNTRLIGNEIIIDDPTVNEIQIEYNRLAKQITNNPELVPDIPTRFHYLYVNFACKEAMMSDEEHERYALFKSEYLEGKLQFKKYMSYVKGEYLSNRPYGTAGAWKVIR